ncbi:Com family DNA-binding transcriptional regulator [Thiopseudomonas alkaliphila]|uniref:Com family DNA-binding transcriptional regulator n=1 Tax=Thiopseudomonas alkaliphila TaxID=1697053 RepID=UPI0009BC6687|nr:Com family DNA-binding transcriptional regulator [Thiopseudomonas alkaliphila]
MNTYSHKLKSIRCYKCNRLLALADGNYQLQIKCPRCKALNTKASSFQPSAELSTA